MIRILHLGRRGWLAAVIGLSGWLAAAGFLTAAEPPQPAPVLPKISVAPQRRGFMTEQRMPFVPFGVNYFRPGTGWAPKLWKQFDPAATRRDFQRMKTLGVNCVRVFLTFGSFYQEPGVLSPEGLAKFDQFLALAAEADIYVHPTGPDHWEGTPDWARGDRLADERVLSALESFWKLFAARYRGRNVIFAYDLLNEPTVRWDSPSLREKWNQWLRQQYGSAEKLAQAWEVPAASVQLGQVPPPTPTNAPRARPLLDFQRFRESIADDWTRRQAAAIRGADPTALVTAGFIQWSIPALLPGMQQYAAFRPERQAKFLDFLELHFYPLDNGFYEYARPEDEERNLAYLEALVREVARPGKPVLIAEFGWYGGGRLTIDGGRHPPASQAQQATWCRHLIETSASLAAGWLNWGLYDHPEARDVTQLTGLLTADGKEKAWAQAFRDLATRFNSVIPPLASDLGPRPVLDWDLCVTSSKAGDDFRREYLKPFKAAARSRITFD